MTSAQFSYTKTSTSEHIVVSGEVVRALTSAHPNFGKVRDYCFAQDRDGIPIDMNHVLGLVDAGEKIVASLLRITDRVSYKGGKLLWDGEVLEGALSDHIVRMIKGGDDDYQAFALFLENLCQNPSKASRAALFEWIADRGFTVTEDGCFVGYKGVSHDYKSLHPGYGVVNGVESTGFLDNTIGNLVEVPRNKVDANRNSSCSYGLHVGTSSYANSYGVRRIIVSVNPRDVVMVPNEASGQKMRVCRYVVLGDNDDKDLGTTTYNGRHRDPVEEDPGQCVYCGGEDDNGTGGCSDCVCNECDCQLAGGRCRCCDGVPEDDVCSDCGDGDCEGDCEDVSFCECGRTKAFGDDECDDCYEEAEAANAEDEADEAAELDAAEAEEAEAEAAPYGRCAVDGFPLDHHSRCTSFVV